MKKLIFAFLILCSPLLSQDNVEYSIQTRTWGEYYNNDKPYNCRTRPRESAINIEALTEYL